MIKLILIVMLSGILLGLLYEHWDEFKAIVKKFHVKLCDKCNLRKELNSIKSSLSGIKDEHDPNA